MFIVLFFAGLCMAAYDDYDDIMEDFDFLRQTSPIDFNRTVFGTLSNFHDGATSVKESKYPWIAQVIHSTSNNYPVLCTAVCVYDSIFITAARCIISLKVKITSVLYGSKRLKVRAFVVPTNQTLQQYDDIGFIVVEKRSDVAFTVSQLYAPNDVKRTDDLFNWYSKMNLSGPFKVVGYAMDKVQRLLIRPENAYDLRELAVVVGIELCWYILTSGRKTGFRVPCYHTCDVVSFLQKKCKNQYLGVEGAAIINDNTKKIFGIATWGTNYDKFHLPVGFSVVQSKAFQEDYDCAKKIKNSQETFGAFQKLCKI